MHVSREINDNQLKINYHLLQDKLPYIYSFVTALYKTKGHISMFSNLMSIEHTWQMHIFFSN